MTCAAGTRFGSPAYLREVFERSARCRVPLSGGLSLTYRCNFGCRHCYVGHLAGKTQAEVEELSTRDIVALLGEAAEAGCLELLLTGGEPLLRRDFVDIYVAAKRLGMITTVFTNGSLLNDAHVRVFAEYPPHEVEITLYGACERTYECVTGVPGSFRRVMRSIDRLLGQGIHVGLKAMILRETADEIAAMEALARRHGLPFRADPVVTARLDGDRGPLQHRADASRAVEIEMRLDGYRAEMAEFYRRQLCAGAQDSPASNRQYLCGGGTTSFQIDARGWLHPCEMSSIAYDARAMGFARAWEALVASVEQAVWEEAGRCSGCSNIVLCGYCPAVFALEDASPARPPDYLCRLGENRRLAVMSDEPEVLGVGAN